MIRHVDFHGSRFYNGDCIEHAPITLRDGSVDLIITDPPYGIDGDSLHRHYNRNEDFVVDGYIEVPSDQYAEFSRMWIKQAERVLKPGGQLYIITGYSHLSDILVALKTTSLVEVNHIIWKYNFGVFTRKKYVSSHYHILYFSKPGGRRTFNLEARFGIEESDDSGSLNYRDREDVWIINREYKPGEEKNKNELPTALLSKIIQYSSQQNDVICDFFLGGFSTARAAIGLNRVAVGFEKSTLAFDSGIRRTMDVSPGWMLPHLRKPIVKAPRKNAGAEWTEEQVDILRARYLTLMSAGNTKGKAIGILGDELGRGRWSITKALKRYSVEAPATASEPAADSQLRML